MSARCTFTRSALACLQHRFVALVLPRVHLHARVFFRHIKCLDTRGDRVAETIDLAWKWFVNLARRGKDATQFVSVLATFAAKAVKSGRRLCGQLKAKDVMSERAQQRHHFVVGKLPDFSTLSENPLVEALTDNTVTPVDEQVAFRLDFPSWRRTYDQRRRRMMDAMAIGHRTMDLAHHFKLSPSRISQMRREFSDDWSHFVGDLPSDNAPRG